MNFKYKYTIFTPCYNSEKFINRVFESLDNQIFRDFEWIVIDDASTDNTLQLLEDYKKKNSFSITLVSNETNQMLYYNINLAFELAKGEYFVFAGHDDAFDSDALLHFNNIWGKYNNDKIARIVCRCRDQFGHNIGKEFHEELFISNYFEQYEKYHRQEMFGCTKTEIIKQFQFDLKNNKIGESFLWEYIGAHYNSIFFNRILRTYYIDQENHISLTNLSRKSVAQSVYLHYKDWVNLYLKRHKFSSIFVIRNHFAYSFYGVLSGKSFVSIISSANSLSSKFRIVFLFPFALCLSKIKH